MLMMRHMFIVALFFLTEVTVFLFHIYGWKNFELSQPILDNARTHPQRLIKIDFVSVHKSVFTMNVKGILPQIVFLKGC